MDQTMRLLMISAMYENGGNTTHRLLDGHPQMHVYPFESQLGTRLVQDHLTSLFPVKYRWPVFPLEGTPSEDYRLIIDEECKVRARTPDVSKFRIVPFGLDDERRRELYEHEVRRTGRSRGGNVMAFFRATFAAWTDLRRSGTESLLVGYSPIVIVDADKILRDLPDAHVLHVVRNPWSAYADTRKRAVPMGLSAYMTAWINCQIHALTFRRLHPESVHVLRFEDIVAEPASVLGELCARLGLDRSPTLATPTWNGETLAQVHPWGTIRTPTPEANRRTAEELPAQERKDIAAWGGELLRVFGYEAYL